MSQQRSFQKRSTDSRMWRESLPGWGPASPSRLCWWPSWCSAARWRWPEPRPACNSSDCRTSSCRSCDTNAHVKMSSSSCLVFLTVFHNVYMFNLIYGHADKLSVVIEMRYYSHPNIPICLVCLETVWAGLYQSTFKNLWIVLIWHEVQFVFYARDKMFIT